MRFRLFREAPRYFLDNGGSRWYFENEIQIHLSFLWKNFLAPNFISF